MSRDAVIIEGHAYSWRALCELRRAQMEARRAAEGSQLVLFDLRDDRRPPTQRTASRRYEQPSLLER